MATTSNKPIRVVIDATNGEQKQVEMTDEEIAELSTITAPPAGGHADI